jgi:hypothetical protein
MIPRLDPKMGEVVLSARVARALTMAQYEQHAHNGVSAAQCATLALRNLPPDYSAMVRFALHSLSVYLFLDWTSTQWLHEVLEASHFGHSFRRCFYFEYKANRSAYPRVTNRGVPVSSRRQWLQVETIKDVE